jgi:hypothetical protein
MCLRLRLRLHLLLLLALLMLVLVLWTKHTQESIRNLLLRHTGVTVRMACVPELLETGLAEAI